MKKYLYKSYFRENGLIWLTVPDYSLSPWGSQGCRNLEPQPHSILSREQRIMPGSAQPERSSLSPALHGPGFLPPGLLRPYLRGSSHSPWWQALVLSLTSCFCCNWGCTFTNGHSWIPCKSISPTMWCKESFSCSPWLLYSFSPSTMWVLWHIVQLPAWGSASPAVWWHQGSTSQ